MFRNTQFRAYKAKKKKNTKLKTCAGDDWLTFNASQGHSMYSLVGKQSQNNHTRESQMTEADYTSQNP